MMRLKELVSVIHSSATDRPCRAVSAHLTLAATPWMSPQALSTAFLLLCSLLFYLLAKIFAHFMTPILWAMILARLFYPIYQRLTRLMGGWTTASAALTTLSVMLLAVLPAAYLLFLAITETMHAYQDAMAWVRGGWTQANS